MLFKLPGSVVCYLSLILKNLQADVISLNIVLCFFCYHIMYVTLFEIIWPFLGVLFFSFSVHFSLRSFCGHIFKLSGSFLGHTQSTGDPEEEISGFFTKS